MGDPSVMAEGVRKRMRLLGLPSLVGPIFTKELRVASRQRKQYVFRFAYLAALTIFLVLSWLTVVHLDNTLSPGMRISRMPEVGKNVVNLVMWFQCIAAQVMAVIVTSTSFSDEIRHRTLAVLATTPLTNLRIVTGKLLGHMLQILVLLGISFPLLAIVRVLGGVPWGFVVAGLGITATASLFASAVTMLHSMRFRRAYVTIAVSIGTVVGAYAVASLVLVMTCVGLYLIPFFVPFVMMTFQTQALLDPGWALAWVAMLWPVHCGIMLAATFGVLLLCASSLRKVALRQATGEDAACQPLPTLPPLSPIQMAAAASVRPPVPPPPGTAGGPGWRLPADPPAPDTGPIRRVEGSPILWREFLRPVLGEPVTRAVVIAVCGATLVLAYLVVLGVGAMDDGAAQAGFIVTYLTVALAWTAVLAAGAIAPEREARCWPLLMTTTLSDRHVLAAKAVGVLRRSAPVWVLLGGHLVLFTAVGLLHIVTVLHLLLVAGGALTFLLGLCLYLSMRLRRTTSAVMLSLAVPLLLWALAPAVTEMVLRAAGAGGGEVATAAWVNELGNPIIQAAVVTAGGTSEWGMGYGLGALHYSWRLGAMGIGRTTLLVAASGFAYMLTGLLLALAARRRFRRDIFL